MTETHILKSHIIIKKNKKNLDPLNTKSYAKALTLTISFLRTCKLILISIKKLTLYNVSTECTSVHKN